MTRFIWLLTAAITLSACTSNPAPTPNNPTPQPLVLDSFAANPNPSPINLGVQFSWSILGGGNKTCKLDVNNDGTFEYTLNGCDSASKQSHVYSGVGTFTAKLVVSDGSSTLEKTTSVGVIAENKKPNVIELIAQQTANPLRVRWVFKVSDAEGDVLTCKLDVNNDGEAEFVLTPCTSNALNSSISLNALNSSTSTNTSNPLPSNTGGAIEYTYPAKGTYTARLEVSDAYNSVSSTRSVNVPVSPEVLEFAANPTTLIAKDSTTFAFKVNSPNSLPLKCTLTTGDGSTFTFDPCPSDVVLKQNYTYMEAGKYTATLSVQDSLGNISTRNLTFNIAPIRFTQISGGIRHTCAIANNQKTYCWGDNLYGQLGNGNTGGSANTPQLVSGGHTFSQISTGYEHTCALTPTGQIYCWGDNLYGQLGNGNNTDANTPQAVNVASLPPGTTFSQISAGGNHTCALTSAGQAYCWGLNQFGQLGNGNYTNANTPQPVSGVLAFSQIRPGAFQTCALTSAGQAYCWGNNSFGQLGNGNNNPANTPQLVSMPLGVAFSQIRHGGIHTCALTSTGQAYCWGWNLAGQLGNGNYIDANTPQPVSGVLTFSQISSGDSHTCALTSAGQAYCWGNNSFGQLGNGNTGTNANTPQPVSGVLTFSQISPGGQHTCALTSAGQAYCWGNNSFGQLGNGNNIDANTPQAVVMP